MKLILVIGFLLLVLVSLYPVFFPKLTWEVVKNALLNPGDPLRESGDLGVAANYNWANKARFINSVASICYFVSFSAPALGELGETKRSEMVYVTVDGYRGYLIIRFSNYDVVEWEHSGVRTHSAYIGDKTRKAARRLLTLAREAYNADDDIPASEVAAPGDLALD